MQGLIDHGCMKKTTMIDPIGRNITYLRVSVTDRCDFRCTYCMAERMVFLPKKDLLTLNELYRICDVFISKGVKKIRITGGEPLVRHDVIYFIRDLGMKVTDGSLHDLALTTNGSQLSRFASTLAEYGVKRINVSLDTLDAEKFRRISRKGDLSAVLDGIAAARRAGLQVKINTVALKGLNEDELPQIMAWAHGLGMDMSLIEVMPMGEVEDNRADHYLPLSQFRKDLATRFTLTDIPFRTGGPARYAYVSETGGRLGFITPMSRNFCECCNRIRLTCTGKLYTCLGRDNVVDLRTLLRDGAGDASLSRAIDEAIRLKARGHEFAFVDGRPAIARHMSVTGG